MFGFKYCLLSLVMILAVGAFWQNDTHAMDLSKQLPKLSAKEVLHYGPSSAFFEQYDQGVQGHCDPLLSHLNEKLQSSDSDVRYSAQLVYAEMYDRAVCVEYSSEKSFEYFKQAADAGGPMFHAHVGWKYYYGHGVEQSEAKANEAFKLLLTRRASSDISRIYKRYEDLLKDRPIPPLLKTGIDWLIEKSSTDDGLIDLAQALLGRSGATYHDGTAFKKDTKAAYFIFQSLAVKHNPKALFTFAKAILNGKIPSSPVREAHMFLEWAANCGYTDAMVEMAKYHQTGEYEFVQTNSHAYAWLYAAKTLGANVQDEMKHLEKHIKVSGEGNARQQLPWNYRPNSCRAK